MKIKETQIEICQKYGVAYFDAPINLKVGIALNIKEKSLFPINGLRHLPQGNTTGWYLWAGEELSEDPEFFIPLHVNHLLEWRPEVLKFLALPPGYRFLIGEDNYEDVWFDENLLTIQ